MSGDVLCFVLEAKLKDDQKIPKRNQRSRLGKFIGFSNNHSSLVANFCNLRNGYISPQYHLVFDDLFDTAVRTGDNDPVIDNICNYLFDSSRDWYAEEEFEPDGQWIYLPPLLAGFCIDECGPLKRKGQPEKQRHHHEQQVRESNKSVP